MVMMPTAGTPPRRTPAVVFDLFGTLVPGGSRVERDIASREIAQILGVDHEAFARLMRQSFDERATGRMGDLRHTIQTLAGRLGAAPNAAALDGAVQVRLSLTRDLHQRTWAQPALEQLTRAGYRLAVVSDCSAETPALWSTSPLAVYIHATSFSCITGIRKPAPEAYMTAIRGLGVDPSDCVYVGDGGSHELTGALNLGMTALKHAPVQAAAESVIDPDTDWTGPTISDLAQLARSLSR